MQKTRVKLSHFFPTITTPVFFAHRGCSARFPENTMPSFCAALNQNIPAIELDVWLTKDHQLVISHNSSTERTTGVQLEIPKSTLPELRTLNFAATYNQKGSTNSQLPQFQVAPEQPLKTKIPTLAELFAVAGNQFFYDIEIKERRHPHYCLKRVKELVNQYQLDKLLVSSFNPNTVRQAKHFHFNATALIFGEETGPFKEFIQKFNIWWSKPDILKPRRDIAAQIAKSTLGIYQRPICTWTVDDKAEAKALFAAGIEGICSNHPEDFIPTKH